MDRQGLFQAMKINNPREKEKDVSKLTAEVGFSDKKRPFLGKDVNKYGSYKKAPNMFSGVIDYSTRRGVLPCYSINKFVGRNPPEFNSTHGMMPIGGMSRTQAPSLVNPRPLDIPIQVPRSNINGAFPTTIPIPGIGA